MTDGRHPRYKARGIYPPESKPPFYVGNGLREKCKFCPQGFAFESCERYGRLVCNHCGKHDDGFDPFPREALS